MVAAGAGGTQTLQTATATGMATAKTPALEAEVKTMEVVGVAAASCLTGCH